MGQEKLTDKEVKELLAKKATSHICHQKGRSVSWILLVKASKESKWKILNISKGRFPIFKLFVAIEVLQALENEEPGSIPTWLMKLPGILKIKTLTT